MAVRSTQCQNRAVRSTQGGGGCHPHKSSIRVKRKANTATATEFEARVDDQLSDTVNNKKGTHLCQPIVYSKNKPSLVHFKRFLLMMVKRIYPGPSQPFGKCET